MFNYIVLYVKSSTTLNILSNISKNNLEQRTCPYLWLTKRSSEKTQTIIKKSLYTE